MAGRAERARVARAFAVRVLGPGYPYGDAAALLVGNSVRHSQSGTAGGNGHGRERFLGTGPFLWFAEIAAILRRRLGDAAAKVPTRQLPNLLIRATAVFDP